jgi:cation diffusion facilitator CzcD-associated flavoprotein CzcO
MGDIAFTVDGEPVDFANTFTYRGIMNSGVPNMSSMFGYLRTSWTMRVDLVADFICQLLNKMDDEGLAVCTPTLREQDKGMEVRPWIEDEEFNANYLKRSMHLLPKQGGKEPWKFCRDYYLERDLLPAIDLNNEDAMVFTAKK